MSKREEEESRRGPLVSFGIDDAVVFAYEEEVESVPSLETEEYDTEEEEEEEEDWESEDEEGE